MLLYLQFYYSRKYLKLKIRSRKSRHYYCWKNPGKDPHLASNYQLISLLSVCYKLLKRILLQRISAVVEEVLSVDKAGFRAGHSTCDQVTSLTKYIANGLKTGAVFVDLTAAYGHDLAHWAAGQAVQMPSLLVYPSSGTPEKLAIPCPHGRRR